MAVRTSEAVWEGKLRDGKGTIKLGRSAFEARYSFDSRFEEEHGTNPEELLAAAHAGCYSMALSAMLEQAGYPAERIRTVAKAHLNKIADGFKITEIELETEACVPGIEKELFLEKAEAAKVGCPVSQALTGTAITLDAKLIA